MFKTRLTVALRRDRQIASHIQTVGFVEISKGIMLRGKIKNYFDHVPLIDYEYWILKSICNFVQLGNNGCS